MPAWEHCLTRILKKHTCSWTFNTTVGFYYCPLVRMFYSRKMNNKINHLQERCLRIVCSDKTSSFGNLLETSRSVPIHIRALRHGFPKKVKIWLLLFSLNFFLNEAFGKTCVTLLSSLFQTWKALFIVTESLSYLRTKIWDLAPKELKELSSLGVIKKWKPQNFLFKISVSFDIFSGILDFFNILIFMLSYRSCIYATCTLLHLIYYSMEWT